MILVCNHLTKPWICIFSSSSPKGNFYPSSDLILSSEGCVIYTTYNLFIYERLSDCAYWYKLHSLESANHLEILCWILTKIFIVYILNGVQILGVCEFSNCRFFRVDLSPYQIFFAIKKYLNTITKALKILLKNFLWFLLLLSIIG